jgi:transcriptional regulator with XRE-family HTH domain
VARRANTNEELEHGRRIGKVIAQRREEAALSAPQLARQSDVAVDTVRSLERGRVGTPAFLTVAKLAAALKLSLDDIQAAAVSSANEGGPRR